MSESKNTQEANTVQGYATGEGMVIGDKNTVIHQFYHSPSRLYTPTEKQFLHEEIKKLFQYRKHEHEQESSYVDIIVNLASKYDVNSILQAMEEERNEKIHGKSNEAINEVWNELANEMKNSPIIPLRINEKPLTPQTLAIAFTALTELITKFWLISKHRFADLIEYTQTHDIRFANEAGATIAWATSNSPFSFGLNLDKVVPSVAEAFVTTLDGIKQRDTRQQKAELENSAKWLENQEKAHQIEEARLKAQHEQEMAELDRKMKELEYQKRQAEWMFQLSQQQVELLERTLELFNKKRDIGIEIAGNAVNILLPDGDASTKLMLGQSLLPNILQIQDIAGLELILPKPKVDEENPKEDAGH